MSESSRTPAARGIDPRGPRFVAGITALLLIVDVFLGLTGISTAYGASGWVLPGPALRLIAIEPLCTPDRAWAVAKRATSRASSASTGLGSGQQRCT